jgi:hypothetical protein
MDEEEESLIRLTLVQAQKEIEEILDNSNMMCESLDEQVFCLFFIIYPFLREGLPQLAYSG